MARDGLPPRFKPFQAPLAKPIAVKENRGRHRISPRRRGYDAAWDRLSVAFRRRSPWCLFCQQERLEENWQATEVADHVLPAHEYPQYRKTWKNLIPLCSFHHDGAKQRLETYARANGLLEQLPQWVWDPMSRPAHLRPLAVMPSYVVPDYPRLLESDS